MKTPHAELLGDFQMLPRPIAAPRFGKASNVRAQSPALQNIRTSIIQAFGAQKATVDLKIAGGIFMISRVSSNLNQVNHPAREGEASRIASVVVKTIVDKPEFSKIHTIRVQYVGRIKAGSHQKIIDTIDFRRDPSGVFHFHTT